MVVCPIAIAVGCRKCPAFSVCPLKNVIGDYRLQPPPPPPPVQAPATKSPRSKTRSKRARTRRPRKR